jgi:hypothetical protein
MQGAEPYPLLHPRGLSVTLWPLSQLDDQAELAGLAGTG